MVHEWVLDVLADLQSFADANDLTALASYLEKAGLVAAAEIRALSEGTSQHHYGDAIATRGNTQRSGPIDRA